MLCLWTTSIFLAITGFTFAQFSEEVLSSPLTDTPQTPYGVDWQTYFRVNNPHIPVDGLPRIFSGSLSVNRTGHANNTLFFMAFEKEDGSLTAGDGERVNEPWMIYIAGGPGGAASITPYSATGPAIVNIDGDGLSFSPNEYAWNKLVDMLYIDQPVGVGFSTVDRTGFIKDEDQMGEDFVNFLRNLVEVFPSFKKRPLYLIGDSYAGVFIPYISKAIFSQPSALVNLAKIIIGEGSVGSPEVVTQYPMLGVMQSYPQLIGFDPSTYEYFVEQYNLCGYNMTLQYPALNPYPSMTNPYPRALLECDASGKRITSSDRQLRGLIAIYNHISTKGSVTIDGVHLTKRQSNTSLGLTPIGSINPDWQCNISDELMTYAMSTLAPWNEFRNATGMLFILNSLFDSILNQLSPDPTTYFNTAAVRAEYHAPEKAWMSSLFPYPFNSSWCSVTWDNFGDPSIAPSEFLSDLAAKVPIVFYSGAGDANVGHRGTELTIQNTTFGGIRGFTMRPSTPFSDSNGNLAGIIHSERNVTYALFKDAGHGIAWYKPNAMYTFLKEFVLGTNQTGTLDPAGSSVIGGEHTEYIGGIFTGSAMYTGAGTTRGTYTWPESVWNAWNSYMATRTAADVPVGTGTGITSSTSQGTSIKLRQWYPNMFAGLWVIFGATLFAAY